MTPGGANGKILGASARMTECERAQSPQTAVNSSFA